MNTLLPHLRRRARAGLTALAWLAVAGCAKQSASAVAPIAAVPEPIGEAECAACGMVVREQPGPRGQLVHRDGTRAFLCSVGDLAQYLRAPSPHGHPIAIWVESVDPTAESTATDVGPRPWVRAERLHYVFGHPRRGIMGVPVLSYESADVARRRAAAVGTKVQDWEHARARLIARPGSSGKPPVGAP